MPERDSASPAAPNSRKPTRRVWVGIWDAGVTQPHLLPAPQGRVRAVGEVAASSPSKSITGAARGGIREEDASTIGVAHDELSGNHNPVGERARTRPGQRHGSDASCTKS